MEEAKQMKKARRQSAAAEEAEQATAMSQDSYGQEQDVDEAYLARIEHVGCPQDMRE
jgi:hypothetical protein